MLKFFGSPTRTMSLAGLFLVLFGAIFSNGDSLGLGVVLLSLVGTGHGIQWLIHNT